jgi:hypothetical protein
MKRPKMKLHLKKGALHKALGVKQGKPISAYKLAQAKHSKSALMRKRATFAENAKKWNHSGRSK